MMMRPLIMALIAGIIAPPAFALPPRPVVSEIIADQGGNARSVPGIIKAQTDVTMSFQTLGRMTTRNVNIGDRVEEGQLLAELAVEDLAAATRAAQANADAAKIQLGTAQATLKRTRELAERNVASTAQLEQALQVMATAEAAMEQARSELIRAQDAQSFTKMKAPFAGVISAVYESRGAVVGTGTPILQLSADDQLEATIDLPEVVMRSLSDNPVFTIWQRMAPKRTVTATLSRIEPLADTATRTRRLYLTLPPGTHFRLGALVRARLGAADDPSLTLPEDAIFEVDGRPHVWRVRRDAGAGQVEPVAVHIAPCFDGRCIIFGGILAGDEIVTRGIHSLQAGQKVGRRIAP